MNFQLIHVWAHRNVSRPLVVLAVLLYHNVAHNVPPGCTSFHPSEPVEDFTDERNLVPSYMKDSWL